MVPFGILETKSDLLHVTYGNSNETSDFIVDALESWWCDRRDDLVGTQKIVINLDNGPQNSSSRTQFLNRMVEFVDGHGITVHLMYYPPYHSKYNKIERCWGILENHWNGALLDSPKKVIEWTKSMTWKGIQPIVKFISRTYEKGVAMTKQAFKNISARLKRDPEYPKYSVIIEPLRVGY
jgi:transposase